MSIFSKNESGVKMYRSRFNLSHRKLFDCDFGNLVPFMAKFVLPGDVWKIGANALIRYQPTLAPVLTRANARFRYFFVPLRLVEPETEYVITGSKNGKLITGALPEFEGVFSRSNGGNVAKYSFLDYLGMPVQSYTSYKNDKCLPAAYWIKAYLRCFFDYYRDENLSPYDDFDILCNTWMNNNVAGIGLATVKLPKDYFTSALPFQLKGAAPTFMLSPSINFSDAILPDDMFVDESIGLDPTNEMIGSFNSNHNGELLNALNKATVSPAGFTMADLRLMGAQTRVFERLARCGSRFTEYLHSNFGVAPADGTLQRAQYLGGFKLPIVTTEVVQTAPATSESNTKVGTLRGHGISNGGNSIKPFVAKEFGVIFGLMDILPSVQYTQGINRELTYKSRFDFFNPSFQHLSEQEIRNGEIFVGSDNKNDDTFGFQPIYNELRCSRDEIVGDLRDSLSYWTQGIKYSSRPNLNENFIDSGSYLENFHEPFAVTDGKPIVCDVGNILDVYRPMVRYSTPGLFDHN